MAPTVGEEPRHGVVFEDHSGPLPRKPGSGSILSFRLWGKETFLPAQRVKIVLRDEDTGELSSEVAVLPLVDEGQLVAAMSETAIRAGKKVTKVVVIEKMWVKNEELSTLEKGLIAVGVLGLLGVFDS